MGITLARGIGGVSYLGVLVLDKTFEFVIHVWAYEKAMI